MENNESIMQKLLDIQQKLKVEKGTYNSFGDFYYRSKEDILEAVKPLCHARGLAILCDDAVQSFENGWVYMVVTVKLIDVVTGEIVEAKASAREPESKPKMDSSQVSGSSASYAGKRALGNLFALDDTKDADSYEGGNQNGSQQGWPRIGTCRVCGAQYQFENQTQMNNSQCQCGAMEFV